MKAELNLKCKINLNNLKEDKKELLQLIKKMKIDFLNISEYIEDACITIQSVKCSSKDK